MTKFRRPAALLGAATLGVVLLGCGSSRASTTSVSATAGTSQPPAEARVVPVGLHLGQGSYAVAAPGATISGTASDGASISVNGHELTVHAGHWRARLHLHIGSNPVEVEATKSGRAPATRVIHIIRHHSEAELEARARARALRAEVRHLHETEARERKERDAVAKAEHERARQQSECPNGTYENSAGNIVCKPY